VSRPLAYTQPPHSNPLVLSLGPPTFGPTGPLPVSTARITATRTGCQPRPPSGSSHLGPTYPAARLPTPHRPTRLADRLSHLTSASTRINPPATGGPLSADHSTTSPGPKRPAPRPDSDGPDYTRHVIGPRPRAHASDPGTPTGHGARPLRPLANQTSVKQAARHTPKPTRPPGPRPLLTPDPTPLGAQTTLGHGPRTNSTFHVTLGTSHQRGRNQSWKFLARNLTGTGPEYDHPRHASPYSPTRTQGCTLGKSLERTTRPLSGTTSQCVSGMDGARCLHIERHSTAPILPSYRRTSWVRLPRAAHFDTRPPEHVLCAAPTYII
jgi:hypothetical protein